MIHPCYTMLSVLHSILVQNSSVPLYGWIYYVLCIHIMDTYYVSKQLGCFYAFTITKCTAINICVQFLYVHMF